MQILALRLGVTTGKHLAEICRENYAPWVKNLLWFMTELAIIGSDIQEVIGSAIAFKLLFGLPLWAGCLITGFDTFTFLILHAFGVRKLEAFFAVLIGTMAVCFCVDFAYVKPGAAQIFGGFEPYVSDYAVVQAVSIVGAVIMPHNIYLHSALVQSRHIDRNRRSKIAEANLYFSIEAAISLFISFLINLAVVSVFAKGFFRPDCAQDGKAWVEHLQMCDNIGLEEAGESLEGLLGSAAAKIWGIGLLAAGQSSVMTGTFAGQYVMEGFWKIQLPQWKRVIVTRSIALIPALLVSILAQTGSGDTLDEWLNVLQSVQLPFALLPVLHFTSSKRIMGEFANGPWLKIFVSTISVGVLGINMYLIITSVTDPDNGLPQSWWIFLLLSVFLIVYVVFIFCIIRNDIIHLRDYIYYKIGRNTEYIEKADQYDQPDKHSEEWNKQTLDSIVSPVQSLHDSHFTSL